MAEAGDVETVNSTVESQRDDRFPLNVVYCGGELCISSFIF